MADRSDTSVLKRMATSRSGAPVLSEMSTAKALRRAFAKAGDEVLGIAVTIQDVTEDTVLPEALADGLPDPALLLQLDGRDGATGVAVLCPQFVGAVIEARTIGTVLAKAAPDRRPTPTDAALAGAFIDPALNGFSVLAAECRVPLPVAGFRCGTAFADPRAVQLKIADAGHLRIRFSIVFGGGSKTGTVSLIYPVARADTSGSGGKTGGRHTALERAVLGASTQLEATLCKLRLPLSELTGLSPGDLVPLTGANVNGVSMVGADGSQIVGARLGRSGPNRAVRLIISAPRTAQMTTALDAPVPEQPDRAAMRSQDETTARPSPVAVGEMLPDTGSRDEPKPRHGIIEPEAGDPAPATAESNSP